MSTRTLKNGRTVTVTANKGVRKRCACPRRTWNTCAHPWHFSFKVRGGIHHRFPLENYQGLFDHQLKTKADAERAADQVRVMIRAGQFPPAVTPAPTTPAALTFEQFTTKWADARPADLSAGQRVNDRAIANRLARVTIGEGVTLGQQPIGLLTTDIWKRVFDSFAAGRAASTFNKYRQCILSMQAWAVEEGYLPRPWLDAKLLGKRKPLGRRKGAKRNRRLAPDVFDAHGTRIEQGEESRLLTHATTRLHSLILAALETGMRQGELVSLQWADVSIPREKLTVRAENTKTRTARTVTLSPDILALLRHLQHDPQGKPHPGTAFVFGNPLGEHMVFPKRQWEACVLRAHGHQPKWSGAGKLAPASREKLRTIDLAFHDLRHEHGSRLLEAGWRLHDVRDRLGHRDITTTSTYLNGAAFNQQDAMTRYGTRPAPLVLHNLAPDVPIAPPPLCNDEDAPSAQPSVN